MARREFEDAVDELDERVVHIARTAKVVKGGRRFSFRAVVVVGDNKGSVGVGVGKAREVPEAIRKGSEEARRSMKKIPVTDTTIPHEITTRFSAAEVFLKPAAPGTSVISRSRRRGQARSSSSSWSGSCGRVVPGPTGAFSGRATAWSRPTATTSGRWPPAYTR